jgi:signal transduction histidine kinase
VIIIGIFWIATVTISAYYNLSRYIFNPVLQLQKGAQRVSEGNLSQPVPVRRQDEINAAITVFNDMTTQLAQGNRERDKLIEELRIANQAAQESVRLKSEFLATMSHELRTPLNAITGYTSIMIEGMTGPLAEETQHMLERVQSNGTNLLALINQVLDLAKFEAGRVELTLVAIDVHQWAKDLLDQTQVLATAKNLNFSLEIDPALPQMLYTDPMRLSQMALNLLSNAFKFTHKGEVNLSLKVHGEAWQIIVRDTGVGIPAHATGYIFEEFRQVDGSTTRQFGGTGLGLSIVRNIAHLMNGEVTVSSVLGKGSTFTLTLPMLLKTNTL